MQTARRNFGNSVGLVIPKQVREALHMQSGQTVQLETSAQGLLIRPAHKYTLDELVAQFDASAAAPDDQIGAWNDCYVCRIPGSKVG